MRSINLLKVALDAEIIRIRLFLKRQSIRIAFGTVAVLLALSVLVIIDILIWQVARLYVDDIPATLILLWVNVVLMAICAIVAMRSTPSAQEIEVARLRQEALMAARNDLIITAAVSTGRTLWARRRSR